MADRGDPEKVKREARDLVENPLLQQSVLGFISGAAAGVGVEKVGDWVGYAVGGSVACLSLAREFGVIKTDPPPRSDAERWRREVRDTVRDVKEDIRDLLPEDRNRDIKKAQKFIVNNSVLAGCFFLGFSAARSVVKQFEQNR